MWVGLRQDVSAGNPAAEGCAEREAPEQGAWRPFAAAAHPPRLPRAFQVVLRASPPLPEAGLCHLFTRSGDCPWQLPGPQGLIKPRERQSRCSPRGARPQPLLMDGMTSLYVIFRVCPFAAAQRCAFEVCTPILLLSIVSAFYLVLSI